MVKLYQKKRKEKNAKATKHFRKMQKGCKASVLKCLKKYFLQCFCLVRPRQAVYLISQANPSREQTGMCQLGLGGATLSS